MLKVSILMFLFCSASSAEIYKWVDQKGRTQYGDKPVKNAQQMKVDEIKKGIKPYSKKQREKKRNKLLESFSSDRKKKNKKQDQIRKRQNKSLKKCIWARDKLMRYSRASSLYDLDMQGQRIILSDKQRSKSTQKLKANIRRYCK